MNNRAYSVLVVKSVDEDKRIIRGVATTPSVDRVGDIIDPLGVKFDNPLPLLWQHEHDKPIGSVKFDKPTKAGIEFEAEIAYTDEPGTLKDRLDEAWQSIKMGLVRAVSIGFRALEYAFMDGGGIRYVETEVYELSAVTIPRTPTP
jgi:HK97 family phage prohead protease